MDQKNVPSAETVARLREASRRFGEGSTALTEADIDMAAIARKALRKAQLEEESLERSAADPEGWKADRQALGAAVALVDRELRAEVRTGIRGDLLLGIGPAALLIGLLSIAALVLNAPVSRNLVYWMGGGLVCLALFVIASAWSFGGRLPQPVRMLSSRRVLTTSAGAAMVGALLFFASGLLLSKYTVDRQRFEVARELRLIDSSAQLTLVAQARGFDASRAVQLAGQATGVDWHVETPGTGGGGLLLAKTSLPSAEAVLSYSSSPGGDREASTTLSKAHLVFDRDGRLLDSSTHLIATVGRQPAGGQPRLLLTGASGVTRTFAVPRGLAVPPEGTRVVASLRGNREVALLQPVEWVARQLPSAAASALAASAATR